MKKIIFSTIALALVATSCADKNAYTISGTTDAADSSYVYLEEMTFSDAQQKVDSALVLAGKFELKGSAVQPAFRVLTADGKARTLVLEPGQITVDLVQNKVAGTVMNDSLQIYSDVMAVIKAQNEEIRKEFTALMDTKYKDNRPKDMPDDIKALSEKSQKINEEGRAIIKSFVASNFNTELGQYTFVSEMRSFSEDEQREYIAKLSDKLKEVPSVKKTSEYLSVLENTAVGKAFTDLKAKDPQGKDIALSDFAGKGKVVLVDFWASWCGPCRQDMPELVKMYKEYQGKDFEIVGISLDKEHDAWVKGIKDLSITWPQISDIKFWDSELAAAYGVRGIPHTVLIDKDGTIAARGLRGEELAAKVAEMLK